MKKSDYRKVTEQRKPTCQRNHFKFIQRQILTSENQQQEILTQDPVQSLKSWAIFVLFAALRASRLLTNLQQCYIQTWLAGPEVVLRAHAGTQWVLPTRGVFTYWHTSLGTPCCTSQRSRAFSLWLCVTDIREQRPSSRVESSRQCALTFCERR